jgi:hypothetical protein
MQVLLVTGLPDQALAAAAAFHAEWLGQARDVLASGSHALLAFSPADHTHRAWRLAAIQGLAREFAPQRVNGVASKMLAAVASAQAYLDLAPGLTGQYLMLDDAGAGDVVSPAP